MKKLALIGCLVMLVCGCATSFTGSAKVDGPDDCRKICGKWNMELAGMVAMGAYTDGCICKVKGEKLTINGIGNGILLGAAGSSGGTVGVYRQMQDE